MAVNPFPITNTWMNYVVLRHTGHPEKPDHFDIMLEITEGEGSQDIALDKMECTDVSGTALTVDPQDMVRRLYLKYEGEMRGNRGFVARVDEGKYQLTDDGRVIFHGRLLSGAYAFKEENEKVCMYRVGEEQ